ncbi:MAG: TIGR01777 family protein [Bdellovibrionales bacterium GWA2_49_15]|nr:MAG: TIGR01777 family protein [Bdellovibrionales bacterium GWA2_49_15]HAZ13212.1 TIGR01777 family protein [Bdellovibrionales bacterium]
MKILITGATGLIGSRLVEALIERGHKDLRILTRNLHKVSKEFSLPLEFFEWNPEAKELNLAALQGVHTVIHLAGESVGDGRWNQSKKDRILNSRLSATSLLIETIKQLASPPKKFISASAIGFYGDRGDEALDEQSKAGEGFLADVCKRWEDLALNHGIRSMQSAVIRTGIVLSPEGGALLKMLPLFKVGLAGTVGTGDQYMSWIHIDDLVGQYISLLEKDFIRPVYNGVSPTPVSNLIFTKTLGRELNRPTLFPVPAVLLQTVLGEKSQLLLASQKVTPQCFIQEGYTFKFQNLEAALKDILT